MSKNPSNKSDFVCIHKAGEIEANIIKGHLESEGIPVLLQFESAGRVYGFTAGVLAETSILVPREFAEEARKVIENSL